MKWLINLSDSWVTEIGPCIICWNIAWTPVEKDFESVGDAHVIVLPDKDYNIICEVCLLKEYLSPEGKIMKLLDRSSSSLIDE